MKTLRLTLSLCALVISMALAASNAQAQAFTTYVSGVGDDVNPCSRTAPCRTFAGAISKTAVGGSILPIDSGGFGSVTITKSVTIDGTGVMAAINAADGNGINVNIIAQGDTAKSVRIRGLSINGAARGANGINVIAGSKVVIENCIIDGFVKMGVGVAAGQTFIRNTTIRNNGDTGVAVSSNAQAALMNVAIVFNATSVSGNIKSFNDVIMYGNTNGPNT